MSLCSSSPGLDDRAAASAARIRAAMSALCGGKRLRLLNRRRFLRLRRGERVRLPRAAAGEAALAREQLAAEDRLLLHARPDCARLVRHAVAHDGGLRAGGLHLLLRSRNRVGDVLVLVRDRAEVVQLVEHILEALRGQQHVDRRRIVLLVDRDEPPVQPLHESAYALRDTGSTRRTEELAELAEAAPPELEIRLQRAQAVETSPTLASSERICPVVAAIWEPSADARAATPRLP
jgi:hypothetical protein